MEDETKTLGICLALITFLRLQWSFVYLEWIHILYGLCSNLHLYDIDLRCMSGSYVQVWFLYHMDLHCILVAMLVYSTHRSSLYWSAAMSLVTCVYESTYWCTTDAYLTACSNRANIFISWQWLVLKAPVYCITLRLMLWKASCYTKILSPSCDKTFWHTYFP